MQKRNSNSRIQIASREKRVPGKSLNINHNKKLVKKLEKELLSKIDNILIEYQLNNDLIPTFAENPQTNNNKIPLKQEEQKIEKDEKEKEKKIDVETFNTDLGSYFHSSVNRNVMNNFRKLENNSLLKFK